MLAQERRSARLNGRPLEFKNGRWAALRKNSWPPSTGDDKHKYTFLVLVIILLISRLHLRPIIATPSVTSHIASRSARHRVRGPSHLRTIPVICLRCASPHYWTLIATCLLSLFFSRRRDRATTERHYMLRPASSSRMTRLPDPHESDAARNASSKD